MMIKRACLSCVLVLGLISSAHAIEPLTPVSEPGQYAFSLEVSHDAQAMDVDLRQGMGVFRGQPDFASTRVLLRGDYCAFPWTTFFLRMGMADMDGGKFTVADLNGDATVAWGAGLSLDFKNEFIISGIHWGGSFYYNSFKSDLAAGDLKVTEYGASARIWKAISPVILYTGPRLSVRDVKINTIGDGMEASGSADNNENFEWAVGMRYDLTKEIALNLEGEMVGRKGVGMSLVYRFGDTIGPMAAKRQERYVENPPWMPKEKEEEVKALPKEEEASSTTPETSTIESQSTEETKAAEPPSPPGLFKIPSLPKFGLKKEKAAEKKAEIPSKAPSETPAVTIEAPKIKEAQPPKIKTVEPVSPSAQMKAPLAVPTPSAAPSVPAAEKIDLAAIKTKANEAYGEGRYDQAADLYEKILSSESNNFQAAYNQATCYYRLRRWEEAESAYKRASEIDPMSVDAKVYLGFSRFRQGNRDGAAEAWKQVLEIDPKNSAARTNLSAMGRL